MAATSPQGSTMGPEGNILLTAWGPVIVALMR